MNETPTLITSIDGTIISINDTVSAITGLPSSAMIDKPLTDILSPEFQKRMEYELKAFKNGSQNHGRVNAAIIGIDSSVRRLSFRISTHSASELIIELAPDGSSGGQIYFTSSSISESQKLLPVARRIAAISRRADSKQELLSKSMAVLTEVTDAICAAAIEWGGSVSDWPIAATAGNFDKEFLKGIFRSSVIGRLARGDVIVKDAFEDGSVSNYSLVLLPLMASETPEAVVILYINESTVMSPIEQQTLGLLGEIIGLGLKALSVFEESADDYHSRPADTEATIALGRLSAGLAHEINNAVTVLKNNTERISADAKHFGHHLSNEELTRDSINAVKIIADLTNALKAFAPEETRDSAPINFARIIDMVISSVRFYAKRGVDLSIAIPPDDTLMVQGRSHYLIKSLYLIFVELIEAALASNKLLNITINVSRKNRSVLCNISVSANDFNIPTILLSQVQKDGVLARLVNRSGAQLGYDIEGNNLSLVIELKAVSETAAKSSPPNQIAGDKDITKNTRGTILIVDDDPAIVRSTRRVLEKDYDILASTSANDAMKIFESGRKIDVIILDIFMPETTGIEFVKLLKHKNESIEKSIIFITGGSADQEILAYLTETSIPMVEKPIDIDILQNYIRNIIYK